MNKTKSLLDGIGNYKETNIYYNKWASSYEKTLEKWQYKAPKKVALKLKKKFPISPKKILDLACGTGLFGKEIKKIYPDSLIDGIDISKKIIDVAKEKKIYRKLICANFDRILNLKNGYDLVSCIGAMTYTKDPKKLNS